MNLKKKKVIPIIAFVFHQDKLLFFVWFFLFFSSPPRLPLKNLMRALIFPGRRGQQTRALPVCSNAVCLCRHESSDKQLIYFKEGVITIMAYSEITFFPTCFA